MSEVRNSSPSLTVDSVLSHSDNMWICGFASAQILTIVGTSHIPIPMGKMPLATPGSRGVTKLWSLAEGIAKGSDKYGI